MFVGVFYIFLDINESRRRLFYNYSVFCCDIFCIFSVVRVGVCNVLFGSSRGCWDIRDFY